MDANTDTDGSTIAIHERCSGELKTQMCMRVCCEVLQPSQSTGNMYSAVSLPNHTFSWAGLVL